MNESFILNTVLHIYLEVPSNPSLFYHSSSSMVLINQSSASSHLDHSSRFSPILSNYCSSPLPTPTSSHLHRSSKFLPCPVNQSPPIPFRPAPVCTVLASSHHCSPANSHQSQPCKFKFIPFQKVKPIFTNTCVQSDLSPLHPSPASSHQAIPVQSPINSSTISSTYPHQSYSSQLS